MNHPSPFHYAVASEINEIIKMNFYGIISCEKQQYTLH